MLNLGPDALSRDMKALYGRCSISVVVCASSLWSTLGRLENSTGIWYLVYPLWSCALLQKSKVIWLYLGIFSLLYYSREIKEYKKKGHPHKQVANNTHNFTMLLAPEAPAPSSNIFILYIGVVPLLYFSATRMIGYWDPFLAPAFDGSAVRHHWLEKAVESGCGISSYSPRAWHCKPYFSRINTSLMEKHKVDTG